MKPDIKPEPLRVYPVGKADREVIDETFGGLHEQERMEWMKKQTKYGYPVFVVWKTVQLPGKDPERRERAVIDIRGLNRIAEDDYYPLSLQEDILGMVAGCGYISTLDATLFFY